MSIRRSWLLLAFQPAIAFAALQPNPSLNLTPRTSELASAQFAQVGPIIAGVLGGLSAVLLLLLAYRIRRRYRMRLASNKNRPKPRWFRLFGRKREQTPSSYWDEYLWEKDLEAFPKSIKTESRPPQSSVAFTDRPLPTVPAITRASSPQDGSNGAPAFFFPRGSSAPSDISSGISSLNVGNPSHQLGMLTPSVDPLEERRRDLAGSTPARRSYVGIPPPMPPLTNAHPPVPPGLGLTHGRSQSDVPSPGRFGTPMRSPRPRSRSDGDGHDVRSLADAQGRRRSSTFSAPVLSPILGGSTPVTTIAPPSEPIPARSTQHMSRRELTLSLYETQEAVAALEGRLSVSTIDIPPLTSHSRFFPSTNNNTDHLHVEVEILRREVRRLQNLLLAPRHNVSSDSSLESNSDNEPNPPPVYST
ncbi:hypothetical protein C8R44DRAFT_33322 [Mycena epipterygia]|nr:hypothetical protein C8R44DRAFT_33322 [Mycena epipterygia]